MPPNTERNGSEASEREELDAQCQAVLEEVSNANSIDIQTANIRSPQYQFQILASNVYVQTLPNSHAMGARIQKGLLEQYFI